MKIDTMQKKEVVERERGNKDGGHLQFTGTKLIGHL